MARRKAFEDELVLLLAIGVSAPNAAAKLGVSPRTVYRWLQNDDLFRRVQQLRSEMWQRNYGMLTAAGPEAIRALLKLVQGGSPPAACQSAARTLLQMGLKTRTNVDFEERLAALEREIRSRPGESATNP